MMVALRLRATEHSQAFLTMTYLGELVQRGGKEVPWQLQKAVEVTDEPTQQINKETQQPFIRVDQMYRAKPSFTEGILTVDHDRILWANDIADDNEFLTKYAEVMISYRSGKAGLHRAGAIPAHTLDRSM